MATQASTIDHILNHLGEGFDTRSMFGEYALYCDGKVVGFVCDNTLFVKILSSSAALEKVCEKGPCYPGSKDYYVVTDDDVTRMRNLATIFRKVAIEVPAKKAKAKKKARPTKPAAAKKVAKKKATKKR